MNNPRSVLHAILCFSFLVSFNTVSNANDNSVRPEWVDKPVNSASTLAGMYARGKTAQEELDSLRAREESARIAKDNSIRPSWIDNPGNGVSASAGMHVRGRTAQEELAILRAREEYAKRFGVKIESAQTMSTTVASGRSNTVGSQISHEELKQVEIKAEVKAKWRDPDSDVLWVWLVPSAP